MTVNDLPFPTTVGAYTYRLPYAMTIDGKSVPANTELTLATAHDGSRIIEYTPPKKRWYPVGHWKTVLVCFVGMVVMRSCSQQAHNFRNLPDSVKARVEMGLLTKSEAIGKARDLHQNTLKQLKANPTDHVRILNQSLAAREEIGN